MLFQVVLMPVLNEIAVFFNTTAERKAAMTGCYNAAKTLNTTQRLQLGCRQYEYSLMSEVYNGVIGE